MYLSSTNPNVLYASLFLQIMGVYTVAPLQSTWMRESPFNTPGQNWLMR
jgi:hypothetical protein